MIEHIASHYGRGLTVVGAAVVEQLGWGWTPPLRVTRRAAKVVKRIPSPGVTLVAIVVVKPRQASRKPAGRVEGWEMRRAAYLAAKGLV